jgi:hypothetical protein
MDLENDATTVGSVRFMIVTIEARLGEHGLGKDNAGGRREFEKRVESRRLEKDDALALMSLRREWCLGGAEFKKEMLEEMEDRLGDHHSGELRRETADVKAQRIVAEELVRLDLDEGQLAALRKSDPAKLAIAARLRRETTLTIKAIAQRVGLGSSKSANAKLHNWMKGGAENEQRPIKIKSNRGKTNQTMG